MKYDIFLPTGFKNKRSRTPKIGDILVNKCNGYQYMLIGIMDDPLRYVEYTLVCAETGIYHDTYKDLSNFVVKRNGYFHCKPIKSFYAVPKDLKKSPKIKTST